jgi:hypothetical protein
MLVCNESSNQFCEIVGFFLGFLMFFFDVKINFKSVHHFFADYQNVPLIDIVS